MYQDGLVTEGQFIALDAHNEAVSALTNRAVIAEAKAIALAAQIEGAKSVIIEAMRDGSLDLDDAQSIANALGITLTRTLAVTISAEYLVTIEVDASTDADDIDDSDFDFTCDYIGEGKLVSVSCPDITIDSVEDDD